MSFRIIIINHLDVRVLPSVDRHRLTAQWTHRHLHILKKITRNHKHPEERTSLFSLCPQAPLPASTSIFFCMQH